MHSMIECAYTPALIAHLLFSMTTTLLPPSPLFRLCCSSSLACTVLAWWAASAKSVGGDSLAPFFWGSEDGDAADDGVCFIAEIESSSPVSQLF